MLAVGLDRIVCVCDAWEGREVLHKDCMCRSQIPLSPSPPPRQLHLFVVFMGFVCLAGNRQRVSLALQVVERKHLCVPLAFDGQIIR